MDNNCCDCASYPYDASLITSQPNSNSYTASLVEYSGGSTSVNFSNYVGGDHRIPPGLF